MPLRTSSLWIAGAILLAATSIALRSTPGVEAQSRPAPPAAATSGDPVRGQYLVEHVAMCVECHSGRDDQGRIIPSERYHGGSLPPGPRWAGDWPVRAPRNAGLPGYNDDQARRLLMQGAIDREGQQLKPPMPRFRMNAQDANDVIAFLRSVP